MTYSVKELPVVNKVLKEYGIDASGASIEEVIDDATYNELYLVAIGSDRYFIEADVTLSEDNAFLEELKMHKISELIPLKLLKPGPDGEYITMFDDVMICQVFKAISSITKT